MTATAVRRVLARMPSPAYLGTDDGELLDQFLATGDGDAFAALVERHGGMVFGVCRRVLRDRTTAEDAFQATFLVLARKASAVQPRERVGAWLYGVAYRTAMKARGREARRKAIEHAWGENRALASPPTDSSGGDVLAAVDCAMNALPEKYRLPLLLCGVEGLGKREAADRLGWAEGTVSSRLARGRDLLRDRLARRGVIIPAAAVAGLCAPGSLTAAVPTALAHTTAGFAGTAAVVSPSVLFLSQEVIRAMTLSTWKLLSVIALSVSLAGGYGFAVAGEKGKTAEKPVIGEKAKEPAKPGEKPAAKPEADAPKKKPGEGDKPGVKPEAGTPKKPGEGDKPAVKKTGRASGKVGAVDATAGTITLNAPAKGEKNRDVTVKVGSKAKVAVDGKPADLKAIPVGANVDALLSEDGKEAVAVQAYGQRLNGIIKKVDGSKVTIQPPGDGGEAVTITVPSDAQIFVAGTKNGTAADLKEGMRAGVQMSVDQKTVLLVKAGPNEPEKGKVPPKKGEPDKTTPKKGEPEKGTPPKKGEPEKTTPKKGEPEKTAPKKGEPEKTTPKKGDSDK